MKKKVGNQGPYINGTKTNIFAPDKEYKKIFPDLKYKKVNITNESLQNISFKEIKQESIGNCYLLASLGCILANDPGFLKKIIRIDKKNKCAYITLYDKSETGDEDGNNEVITNEITYQISLSTIEEINKEESSLFYYTINSNNHNHHAIDLLEKAFALHRHITGKIKHSRNESKSKDNIEREFQLFNEDLIKRNNLKEKLLVAEENIANPTSQTTLQKALYDYKNISNEIKLIEKCLREKDKSINQLINDTGKSKKGSSYFGSLTSGMVDDAFFSLLGCDVNNIAIDENLELDEFLISLASHITIVANIVEDCNDKDQFQKKHLPGISDKLSYIFGDLNKQANFELCYQFLESCLNYNKSQSDTDFYNKLLFKMIQLKDLKEKDPFLYIDKSSEYKNMFLSFPGLNEDLKNLISDFFDKTLSSKRGSGKYNTQQNEIYKEISDNLKNGELVCLSTKEKLGHNKSESNHNGFSGENTVKGLAGPHAYQVLDCFKKGDLKFLLVRNPWGCYERHYKQVPRFTQKGELKNVLSATSQPTAFFKKSTPITDGVLSSSKRNELINMPGIFMLEFSDVTKRCNWATVTKGYGNVSNELDKNSSLNLSQ